MVWTKYIISSELSFLASIVETDNNVRFFSVIKKLSTKVTQERIDNFFMSERFALPEKGNYQSSRRVKQAIDKVLGKVPEKTTREQKSRGSLVKRKQRDENHETSPRKSARKNESESEIQVENETASTIQPAKDWKKEEELQKSEAKRKAAEILSKSKTSTEPESDPDFEEAATFAEPSFPPPKNSEAEKSKNTAKPVTGAGTSTNKNKPEEKKEIAGMYFYFKCEPSVIPEFPFLGVYNFYQKYDITEGDVQSEI